MNWIYNILFLALLTGCAAHIPKVDRICIPVESRKGDRVIRQLNSEEWLYKVNGKRVIGPANECNCLPPDAMIQTPSGSIEVSNIEVGDTVFTADRGRNRIMASVQKIKRTPVPLDYNMLQITLADDRVLTASASHPIAIFSEFRQGISAGFHTKLLSTLKQGKVYDGSEIIRIDTVKYAGDFTYDIRPEGETGTYWANDILIASTLLTNVTEDSDTLLQKIQTSQQNVSGGACCRYSEQITVALTANTYDSIEITSINDYVFENQKIVSNQFRDTLFLVIEYAKDDASGYSNLMTKLLKGGKVNEVLAQSNLIGKESEGSISPMPWPISINYQVKDEEYELTLMKPDATSSIFPP